MNIGGLQFLPIGSAMVNELNSTVAMRTGHSASGTITVEEIRRILESKIPNIIQLLRSKGVVVDDRR